MPGRLFHKSHPAVTSILAHAEPVDAALRGEVTSNVIRTLSDGRSRSTNERGPIKPRRQNVGAYGLVQRHPTVRGDPPVTPEGGFDLGSALLDGGGSRGLRGDDAGQELVQVREMFATEIIAAV